MRGTAPAARLGSSSSRGARHDDPGPEHQDANELRVLLRRAGSRRPRTARRQGPRAVGDGAPRRTRPCGFTITTDACRAYLTTGGELPGRARGRDRGAHRAARARHRRDASAIRANPLLVSVRSGAAISMPGMMDTILDLGLNDEAVRGLAAATGNARFAHDSYRRLIQMYGEVVEGIDSPPLRGCPRRAQGGARRRERRRPHRVRPEAR